jgi:LmbE family N-acetylglucosaminyl deacetylase/glycosyltransferase involved in cell wall biosynthesis
MLEEQSFIPYSTSDLPPGPYLVFAPHPDDETFGMGGTIALAGQAGIAVHVVVLTDGQQAGDPEKRRQEAKDASQVLGLAGIDFWELPDRELYRVTDIESRVLKILKSVKPRIVFLPSLQEFHPDHRAATLKIWSILQSLHYSGQLWTYEITRQAEANRLIDTTEVVSIKQQAMRCYKSQLALNNYESVALGLNQARTLTLQEGITHAEAFFEYDGWRNSCPYTASLTTVKPYWQSDSMAKDSPLVSIIIRTKDRPKFLLKALSSLAKQTYRPLEAVVVNDGGCDLDISELGKVLGDVSLCYLSLEKNVGRTKAANIGIEKANGYYVGFLDDDDELNPDHVATLSSLLQQVDYKVAYADTEIVFKKYDADSGTITDTEKRLFVERDFSYKDLLVDNYIPLISLLFERKLLLSEEGFDESFDLYEDWDLLIRCASHTPFYHVKKITSSYIQWSSELQIAQSGYYNRKAERAYDRIIEKHRKKIGPDVVRHMLGYRKANESLKKELHERETSISRLEEKRGRLEHKLTERARTIDGLEYSLHEKERRLQDILYSDGWKLLSAYYRFREALLPRNSRRLLWAQLLKLSVSNPRAFIRSLKRKNIRKFFMQYNFVGHETVSERVQRKVIQEQVPKPKQKPVCEVSVDDVFSEDIADLLPPEDKRHILIIDRALPAHDQDSGSLRMISILGLLVDMGYTVTFLPDDQKKVSQYDADLQEMGVRTVYFDNSLEEFFQKEGAAFSQVLVSRPEQTYKYLPYIRAYAIHSSVIYDTIDLHWVRFERKASLADDDELLRKVGEYKAIELSNASSSDITLTVTEDEKKTLLQENPDLSVSVLPNIHEVVNDVPPFSERKDLMFIGGYEHQPNEDAMMYFVEDILPLIRKKIPGIRLFVVGSKPSEKILGLASDNVEVTGYVKNISPYFKQSRLFVSPLRYGAGMKGKIGQSMSFGLPVVTTRVGAEGMGLKDGETALIADTVDNFSQAVVRLYNDEVLWNTISENGLSHIDKNYSKTATRKRIADILGSLEK